MFLKRKEKQSVKKQSVNKESAIKDDIFEINIGNKAFAFMDLMGDIDYRMWNFHGDKKLQEHFEWTFIEEDDCITSSIYNKNGELQCLLILSSDNISYKYNSEFGEKYDILINAPFQQIIIWNREESNAAVR